MTLSLQADNSVSDLVIRQTPTIAAYLRSDLACDCAKSSQLSVIPHHVGRSRRCTVWRPGHRKREGRRSKPCESKQRAFAHCFSRIRKHAWPFGESSTSQCCCTARSTNADLQSSKRAEAPTMPQGHSNCPTTILKQC